MTGYIILKNGKKIKTKTLDIHQISKNDIEDLDRTRYIADIKLSPIYFGYFNSDETSIISGYYKKWFKKSKPFFIDENFIPWYTVTNKELLIRTVIEDI